MKAEVGAHVGDPVLRVELDSIQVEQLSEVLAVPELLIVPARKECGEDGIHARPRDQEVRQIKRDVVLDVHHVVEAEQVPLGERAGGHRLPVDPGGVEFLRLLLVTLDAEAHPSSNPFRRSRSIRISGSAGSFSAFVSTNSQLPHKAC